MRKALMTKENWGLLNACRAEKSESREALKNINITDQYVEATNGRIAVRFKIEALSLPNMETGVYKVISAAKYDKMFFELILEHDPEAQFPDTKKIFPENATAGAMRTFEILPERTAKQSISGAIIYLYQLTGNGYSAANLAKVAKLSAYWKVYNQGKDKAVYMLAMENSAPEVLIMPFKLEFANE